MGSVNGGTEGINGGSESPCANGSGSARGDAAARASTKPKVRDTADMMSDSVGSVVDPVGKAGRNAEWIKPKDRGI